MRLFTVEFANWSSVQLYVCTTIMFAQTLQPRLSRTRCGNVSLCSGEQNSFSCAQNRDSDSDGSRTVSGSELQRSGPEQAKLFLSISLCPTVKLQFMCRKQAFED